MKKEIALNNAKNFAEMIYKGQEMIYNACKMMVADFDENPESKQDYINSMPNLPSRTWVTFENIGRDKMDWRLAQGGVKNEKYIRELPISTQRSILDGDMVELLTTRGDSIWIDSRECCKEQAEQIFDGGRVRTLNEQAAYAESIERSLDVLEKAVVLPEPYRVKGTKAIVVRACELTKADLLSMLGEIK